MTDDCCVNPPQQLNAGLVRALLGRVLLQPGVALPRVVFQASVVAGDGLDDVGGEGAQAAAGVYGGAGGPGHRGLPAGRLPGAGVGVRVRGRGVVDHHADWARREKEEHL